MMVFLWLMKSFSDALLEAPHFFKSSYFSEWYISASLFEVSTVKTSYANYA